MRNAVSELRRYHILVCWSMINILQVIATRSHIYVSVNDNGRVSVSCYVLTRFSLVRGICGLAVDGCQVAYSLFHVDLGLVHKNLLVLIGWDKLICFDDWNRFVLSCDKLLQSLVLYILSDMVGRV